MVTSRSNQMWICSLWLKSCRDSLRKHFICNTCNFLVLSGDAWLVCSKVTSKRRRSNLNQCLFQDYSWDGFSIKGQEMLGRQTWRDDIDQRWRAGFVTVIFSAGKVSHVITASMAAFHLGESVTGFWYFLHAHPLTWLSETERTSMLLLPHLYLSCFDKSKSLKWEKRVQPRTLGSRWMGL